jgi:hypothetical protein
LASDVSPARLRQLAAISAQLAADVADACAELAQASDQRKHVAFQLADVEALARSIGAELLATAAALTRIESRS